jgi:Flp pilus assembly protein TadD
MKIALLILLLFLPLTAQSPVFALRFDQLAAPLSMLNMDERKVVDDAIELIRSGRHLAAFERLSVLSKSRPDNSSLHILVAYTLLQAGNIADAFREATTAHEAPDGSSYKCVFRAKIALLTGDTAECKHEIQHLKKVGDQPADLRQITKDLKNAKRVR